jgi:hypothetical protein
MVNTNYLIRSADNKIGTPDNGTQAQGWQEMTDTNFYNQVWLVESTAGQYWTLRNLRSGSKNSPFLWDLHANAKALQRTSI